MSIEVKEQSDPEVQHYYGKLLDKATHQIEEFDVKQFICGPKIILVKPFEPKKKTKGGVELPEIAQQESKHGVIVGIGANVGVGPEDESDISVGDVVLYRAMGDAIEIKETKFLALEWPDDILGHFACQTTE